MSGHVPLPFGELVVTGRRQMAARADRGRSVARSHGDFDALLGGTEIGELVDKTQELSLKKARVRDHRRGQGPSWRYQSTGLLPVCRPCGNWL